MSLLPTFEELRGKVTQHNVSSLALLPNPMFSGMSSPKTQQTLVTLAWQQTQLLATIGTLMASMGAVTPHPQLPQFDAISLVTGPSGAYTAEVQKRYVAGDAAILGQLPNPMLPSSRKPQVEGLLASFALVNDYLVLLVTKTVGFAGDVASAMEIGGPAGLPAFPTYKQLAEAAAIAKLPDGSIQVTPPSFPGMSAAAPLPKMFNQTCNNPDVDLVVSLLIYQLHLIMEFAKPITTYCLEILGLPTPPTVNI